MPTNKRTVRGDSGLSRAGETLKAQRRVVLPYFRRLRFEALEDRRLLDGTAPSDAIQLFSTSTALFVENRGQWQDELVRYGFDGPGVNIAFRDEGLSFLLTEREATAETASDAAPLSRDRLGALENSITRSTQFSVSFDGANRVTPIGLDEGETRFNYFVGDQANWASDVPGFKTVVYAGLYDGIDLHTFGRRDSMKYEFHVAPGADYSQISVSYEGIDRLWIDDEGALHVETVIGPLVDDAPYIYQVIDGARIDVTGRFVLVNSNSYVFEITDSYDPTVELVIDPNLDWATYLGGSGSDEGHAIAIDTLGNVLVTGESSSTNFAGANNSYRGGSADAFVAKVSNGGTLQWAAYLGGNDNDRGFGIAVDTLGNVLVTGESSSTNFAGANNSYHGSDDAFVAKITSGGTLQWATYLGGSGLDHGLGIAVDTTGSALVTGQTGSTNFVGANNSHHRGFYDAFVAKVTSAGTLQWATYLGGTNPEYGSQVDVDASGNALVTGATASANFAGANNSYRGLFYDVFVAKVTSAGTLQWATYLGGDDDDEGSGIAVDASGNALVTGYTWSANFPGANNSHHGGDYDGFVAKVTSGGTLQWATYLGGGDDDFGANIDVDASGSALVTGNTWSPDFAGANNTHHGGSRDAFVAKVSGGGMLQWATYLGGSDNDRGRCIAVDASGNAVVTGVTASTNFAGAINAHHGGDSDSWVARIEGAGAPLVPGVTIITHGWQPFGNQGDDPPGWTMEMAKAILVRAGGSGNIFVHDTRDGATYGRWVPLSALGLADYTWSNSNRPTDELVLVYNWVWDSNDGEDGWLQAAADNLFASLLNAPVRIGMDVLNRSLHFIGHSRGAVVNSLVTDLLGYYFPEFVIDQVTTLDPHPIQTGLVSQLIYEADDPEIYTYKNVRYADNYFQQNGTYQGGLSDPLIFDGKSVAGARNVELDNDVLSGTSPNFLDGGHTGFLSGGEHADTHLWYSATVSPQAPAVEEEDLFEEGLAGWWISGVGYPSSAEPLSGRANVGYARTRIGGSDRSGLLVTNGHAIVAPESYVFNGDFSYGDGLNNEMPGWERHGGSHQGDLAGGRLHLGESGIFNDTKAVHNPLYFPGNVNKLTFEYEITDASLDDQLRVYVGTTSVKTIPLDSIRIGSEAIDVTAYRGSVDTIKFELFAGSFITSDVYIDNVNLTLAPFSIEGDFNVDGTVNASDYVLWRNELGSTVARFHGADGNGDGVVNQLDQDVWRANFGRSTPPSGIGGSASVAIETPPQLGAVSAIIFSDEGVKQNRLRASYAPPRRSASAERDESLLALLAVSQGQEMAPSAVGTAEELVLSFLERQETDRVREHRLAALDSALGSWERAVE